MDKKSKGMKAIGTDEENRKYLLRIFSTMKRMENVLAFNSRKKEYNTTELRLMSEIVLANCEGRRVISTQLAASLGVSRSAVSQIVNKLEEKGAVCRVADAVDKKIAYIELTENSREKFEEAIKETSDFVGRVVANFGGNKMERLLTLIDEFETVVLTVKKTTK
ncbi:MAG: MarR family transcriptional regulator [Clostridia bacterium]|nr:MarR family transcriptional regulator [Clostridia bacterium]